MSRCVRWSYFLQIFGVVFPGVLVHSVSHGYLFHRGRASFKERAQQAVCTCAVWLPGNQQFAIALALLTRMLFSQILKYKRSFWFWELVIICQKSLLMILIVFASQNSQKFLQVHVISLLRCSLLMMFYYEGFAGIFCLRLCSGHTANIYALHWKITQYVRSRTSFCHNLFRRQQSGALLNNCCVFFLGTIFLSSMCFACLACITECITQAHCLLAPQTPRASAGLWSVAIFCILC